MSGYSNDSQFTPTHSNFIPNNSNDIPNNSNSSQNTLTSIVNRQNAMRQQVRNLILHEGMDNTDDQMMMMIIEQRQREEMEEYQFIPRVPVQRDRLSGHDRLFADYFAENPVYPERFFRRRFRMNKALFIRIMEALVNHSEYFRQRYDCTCRVGASPLQKCAIAVKQLAYGAPADSYDDSIRVGETTGRQTLYLFCQAICEVFGSQYLRRPTDADVQRLLQLHMDRHGFPGMLGSLDCMHWEWRSCPTAWQSQYTRGDHGYPTIMLEAVASFDLWIWHAFFGKSGSNNDINVLHESHLFNDVVNGYAPYVNFMLNGTQFNRGYYLVDGIYPEWAVFVKTFKHIMEPKRKLFAKKQESARKDVERAFGVLQARWAIIQNGARAWHKRTLKDIMYACIILHNMIVEDEGENALNYVGDGANCSIHANRGSIEQFRASIERRVSLRDREMHHQLRGDLVEHVWQQCGHNYEESD